MKTAKNVWKWIHEEFWPVFEMFVLVGALSYIAGRTNDKVMSGFAVAILLMAALTIWLQGENKALSYAAKAIQEYASARDSLTEEMNRIAQQIEDARRENEESDDDTAG